MIVWMDVEQGHVASVRLLGIGRNPTITYDLAFLLGHQVEQGLLPFHIVGYPLGRKGHIASEAGGPGRLALVPHIG